MPINWEATQRNLLSAGFNPGPVDGLRGRMTLTALFAYAARRQPDATLRSIGNVAVDALAPAGILDTPPRLGEFIAQTSHESAGYTRFEENLRYSAKRLMAVWPSRFRTLQAALPYAWDPSDPDLEDKALANLVYGSRMGNEADGTADDDGWDHRGSGMLQHTGAAEFQALRERLGYTPDDVRDPVKSLYAAADYWTRRGVNSAVGAGKFTLSRQKVNGGTIGLADIAERRNRLLRIIK